MWKVLRETFTRFNDHECPRLAAALAYSALFSLPSLAIVIVSMTELFVSRDTVVANLDLLTDELAGSPIAQQIAEILARQKGSPFWQSAVSVTGLLVGATAALVELQTALNRIWQVRPDSGQSNVRSFLTKRLISLAMVLIIAVLVLVSVMVTWFVAHVRAWTDSVPWQSFTYPTVLAWADHLVSLAALTVMFAVVMRYLPDARLAWADVSVGAAVTALLFDIGKALLAWYLAWADPASVFGAAGSLALVLIWIYYCGLIFLLGAEFTATKARARGRTIEPEPGAVREYVGSKVGGRLST